MDYRSFWVAEADDTAPSAPTGLSATSGISLVSLDWNDNTEGDLDTYTVYRSTTPGRYEEALAGGLSSSSYTDYLVDRDTTYYYTVTASDYHANESSQSAEVFATPAGSIDSTPPAAPTGLWAAAGDGSVNLDWDDNAEGDLHSYSVYRSTTSGSYGSALVSGLSSSVYADPSAVNGTTYYYKVTAVDISANESPKSAEVFATPEEGTPLSYVIVFGSSNDGSGGFTQMTPGTMNVTWSTQTDSVQYRNQDGGTQNSSFLREFVLDRSDGSSYTIEGVVHLTDGYADDNNRVGLYLFGDYAEAPNEDEAGAIGLIFNTDDSSASGAPGSNVDDDISIRVGIDSTGLSDDILRNQDPLPYAQDLFGTDIALRADITFTNVGGTSSIQIVGTLTDWTGAQTITPTVTVSADAYTGDWFGFVTRARARAYAGPGGTPEGRSLPWVMDYKSFSITDSSAPDLEGYELWATGWGTDIGAATHDHEPDGVVNWVEYALGGDPTLDDAADILPTRQMRYDEGSYWLYYTYNRRAWAADLTYTVWSGTNLVEGLTNEVPAWRVSPATNNLETVVHRMSTEAAPNGFMMLEIERSD
jgi:fibronectin type 3 domain-containing protein